jgi:hypothetical protein
MTNPTGALSASSTTAGDTQMTKTPNIEAKTASPLRACIECGRMHARPQRRCHTCFSRKARAAFYAKLGDQDPYLAALEDPDFVAKLDRYLTAKTMRDPASGCLFWTGATFNNGGGKITFGYTQLVISRLVALRAGRMQASDSDTRHACDQPTCVDETHLSGGTRADNNRDIAQRNRGRMGVSGIRGVQFRENCTNNPWEARISVKGKTYSMGFFPRPALAASFVIGARKHLGLGV